MSNHFIYVLSLFAAYSLGLSIPFLLLSLVIDQAGSLIRAINRRLHLVSIISGAFLIIMGVLIFQDQVTKIDAAFKLVNNFTLESTIIGNVATPSFFLAFLAGVLSCLSPCVFPLLPGYIGYLSGVSAQNMPAEITNTPGAMGTGKGLSGGSGNLQMESRIESGELELNNGSALLSSRAAKVIPARSNISGWAGQKVKLHTFFHALAFTLGFSFIFIVIFGGAVGLFGSAFSGSQSFHLKQFLRYAGGSALVLLGLHTMGVIQIPFLYYEKRLHVQRSQSLGYFSSVLVGMAFAAGWTPCVGPMLGLIASMAAVQ